MHRFVVWGADFRQETVTPLQIRYYLWVLVFTVGNLIFPALVHSVPQGGLIFLPLYFFTLIAAYRWGWWAGLTTALVSPLANTILTGMPPLAVLDVLLVKSLVLAAAAAWLGRRTKQISLGALALVIVAYQVIGGVYEAVKAGSALAAFGDWQLGWPGLLLQLFGGGLILGLWRGRGRQTTL